jgi:thiamine biosynthesis lipoprotein
MELDFGGFGKEYAVDRACAVLIERGVHYGFVNLGGDLRAIGPQPDGMPWSMGIQDPRDTRAVAASLPLTVGSLATSGDYERFMEIDGRRYCHILNPRTGMPVSAWRSLSVLAPVAIAAGSYSTIGMLRESGAPEWLDANEVPWLGIDIDGVVHQGAHRPDALAAAISRG